MREFFSRISVRTPVQRIQPRALADRLGYKLLIAAGFVLRTAAFGLLGLVDSVLALIAATVRHRFRRGAVQPRGPRLPRATPARDGSRYLRCSTSSTRPGHCSARYSGWR